MGTLEDIAGLRWRDANGQYHEQRIGEPVMDLDALPWPHRENSLHKNYRMGKSIGVATGRGCPFHCAFCYEGAVSKIVRLRSVEHVMREIDEVRSYNASLRYVNFFDDTFTLQTDRVKAFCREMKSRGLNWTCEGHVACLYHRPELLEEMASSGLTAMQIGIESGSRRILKAYQKNTTPEMIEAVVRQCHQAGLQTVEGNYIIGGAYETDETLEESLSHAKRLIAAGRGMLELKTAFLAPYYGTPITKRPEEFGIQLLPDRIARMVYSMHEPVVQTYALSAEELSAWKRHFDEELWRCYQEQAAECTRSDLLRGPLPFHLSEAASPTWRQAWRGKAHFMEFLLHATEREQTFSEEKYPLHTGSGQERADGAIQIDSIILKGDEAAAWRSADGRRTVRQIAHFLRLSAEKLGGIYRKLNNLCLVYYSPY